MSWCTNQSPSSSPAPPPVKEPVSRATRKSQRQPLRTCCCARSFSANSVSIFFTSSCIFTLLIFSCATSLDSLLFSAANFSHFPRSSSICNPNHAQQAAPPKRGAEQSRAAMDLHVVDIPLVVLSSLVCIPASLVGGDHDQRRPVGIESRFLQPS